MLRVCFFCGHFMKTRNVIISRLNHSLPKLPYAYDALEPIISRDVLELHHKEHHQAYISYLNVCIEGLENAINKGDLQTALCLQPMIKYNGGGHINHSILWSTLSPNGGYPSDGLCTQIIASFGTLDLLMDKMVLMSFAIEGSGWTWLGYNANSCRLQIATCSNEDPLQPTTGLIPIYGIDFWEHSYHKQYKRNRAKYARKLFQIVNWFELSRRYEKAEKVGQSWKNSRNSH